MVKRGIRRLSGALFGAMAAAILIALIFFSGVSYPHKKEFLFSNPLCLLFGLLTLGLLYLLYRVLRRRFPTYVPPDRAIYWLAAAHFLLLAFLVLFYRFETNWDVRDVVDNAFRLVAGQEVHTKYFVQYSNNFLLLALFSGLVRLAQALGLGAHAYLCLVLFQCVLYAVVGVLVFQILRDYTGRRGYAWLGWGVYLLLLGLSPWVVIPYSDSVALLFTALVLRLYCAARARLGRRGCWFWLFFCAWVGMEIKPTVLFALAAVLLAHWLDLERAGEKTPLLTRLKKLVCSAAPGAAGLLSGWLLVFLLLTPIKAAIHTEKFAGCEFTFAHYLMMGFNEQNVGTYLHDDVVYSQSFPDPASRTRGDLERLGKRLRAMGPDGVARQLGKKLFINFNDGTFAWSEEGNFYRTTFPDRDGRLSPFLKSVYYEGGRYYGVFVTAMQIIWITLLFLGLFTAGGTAPLTRMMQLALMALTLFVLLFEARARYLFLYAPYFLTLGVGGLQRILGRLHTPGKAAGSAAGVVKAPLDISPESG